MKKVMCGAFKRDDRPSLAMPSKLLVKFTFMGSIYMFVAY